MTKTNKEENTSISQLAKEINNGGYVSFSGHANSTPTYLPAWHHDLVEFMSKKTKQS